MPAGVEIKYAREDARQGRYVSHGEAEKELFGDE
jgi:hypothetical protein